MQIFTLQFTQILDCTTFASLAKQVSHERQSRLAKFMHWQDAHRCLLAELLIREVSSQWLGLAPNEIKFAKGTFEKPTSVGHPDLHFNLSHSGPWVVCVIGSHPVGIDVEGRQNPQADFWPDVLSPIELKVLAQLPEPERAIFVTRLWTGKESYAKGLGLGLNLPFREITLCVEDLNNPSILDPTRPDTRARFRFFTPDSNHQLCVCTFDQEPPSTVTPLALEMLVQRYLER